MEKGVWLIIFFNINICYSWKASWQYLYWKTDGKCYPIFKQGYPCPATLELVFDSSTKEAKCQCPSGRLYWEEDGRCYEPFTPGFFNNSFYFSILPSAVLDLVFIQYVRFCLSGPCPEGSFLHPGQEVQSRGMQRQDPLRRTLHQVQVSWSSPHPSTRRWCCRMWDSPHIGGDNPYSAPMCEANFPREKKRTPPPSSKVDQT